jgi:very-short-patch-repair endonuclease
MRGAARRSAPHLLITFHVPLPLGERLGEGGVSREDYDSDKARELRRDGSRAERTVWELVRSRRIEGVKFRRQHAFRVEADARRTAAMEREGWHVVRFWANEVVQNPEGIWTEIERLIEARPSYSSREPSR